MAWDASRDRIVLFGGYDGYYRDDAWEYDGTAWSPAAPVPPGLVARAWHRMVYNEATDRVILFGGYTTYGGGNRQDTWEFDGKAWSTAAAAAPPGRWRHAMTYDAARARTIVFGGCCIGGNQPLDDTWELDGDAWLPVNASVHPSARSGAAMAFDRSRGVAVLFGGENLADTWEYDAAGWRPVALSGPMPRADHGMVFDDARGEVVLFGGSDWSDTWTYDGTSWVAGPLYGQYRSGHAMTYEASRARIVVFGGSHAGFYYFDDTIGFDGAAWTSLDTDDIGDRAFPAMAFDESRDVVVMFGGDGEAPDGTWEYDGIRWTRASVAPGPFPIGFPGMAYHSAIDRVVLDENWDFSGVTEWWTYDGQGWTLGAPVPSPLQHKPGAVLAYDETRARTVLYGGCTNDPGTGDCTYLDETWEFDGASWVQTVAGPPGRWAHAMAFHPAVGIVMFGGGTGTGGALNDTWTYDGTAWTRFTGTNPSTRWSHSLTYDPDLGVVVMFGGTRDGSSYLGDTRFFDGAAWQGGPQGVGVQSNYTHGSAYSRAAGGVVLFGGRRGDGRGTWELECLTLGGDPLPIGVLGRPYEGDVLEERLGGATALVHSGSLPPGIVLAPSGRLSGTPSQLGSYDVFVRAQDGSGCAGSKSYTMVVQCLDVRPETLPSSGMGGLYRAVLSSVGGSGAYTYALTGGRLPPGMTLSSKGVVSGVPTSPGSYGFEVTSTDGLGCSGARVLRIEVL